MQYKGEPRGSGESQYLKHADFQHKESLVYRFVSSYETVTMKWEAFFALRRSRRVWERNGGLLLGVSSFMGASYYFGAVKDFDPFQTVAGMDPYVGSLFILYYHKSYLFISVWRRVHRGWGCGVVCRLFGNQQRLAAFQKQVFDIIWLYDITNTQKGRAEAA